MSRIRGWIAQLTIRAKLTATFTLLLALSGIGAIVAVYSYSTNVPDFGLATGVTMTDKTPSDQPEEGSSSESSTQLNSKPEQNFQTTDLESVDDILNQLMIVLIISVASIVALGGYLTWVLSGKLLRPLHTINEAAQLAATGAFEHRVDTSGPHDEIWRLSETFNHMLDKIQRSFLAHERFTANASHEMRTPIAAIKTTLEVALSDPDADAQSLRNAAERVQQLNDRTTTLINSLLDLTVIDNAEIERDQFQLSAVLRHSLETVADEAQAAKISIQSTGMDDGTEIFGDEMLVEQAFTNLLQNAIRHNCVGGDITLRLEADDAYATVMLENSGNVIAPDLIAKLTEPFFRGAGRAVNSDAHRGFGLGLTLVQSIILLHGGEMLIEARDGGGLRIVVQIPRQNQAS